MIDIDDDLKLSTKARNALGVYEFVGPRQNTDVPVFLLAKSDQITILSRNNLFDWRAVVSFDLIYE